METLSTPNKVRCSVCMKVVSSSNKSKHAHQHPNEEIFWQLVQVYLAEGERKKNKESKRRRSVQSQREIAPQTTNPSGTPLTCW